MTNQLMRGRTKSCGCARIISNGLKVRDLSGNSYCSWTVIGRGGDTPLGQAKWQCKCLCGVEREVIGTDLINGKSRSCGCTYGHRFGEKSSGWKGGISPRNKLIRSHLLKTTTWRKDIYERDDYTCARCGKRGGRLHAHHCIRLSNIIEKYQIKCTQEVKNHSLLFDIDNGITLCMDCHKWVHSTKNKNNEFLVLVERKGKTIQEIRGEA